MQIKYTNQFLKDYNKAPKKIQIALAKRIKIFLNNPYHVILNNHLLKGKLRQYRSINITGDWRALLKQEWELIFLLNWARIVNYINNTFICRFS